MTFNKENLFHDRRQTKDITSVRTPSPVNGEFGIPKYLNRVNTPIQSLNQKELESIEFNKIVGTLTKACFSMDTILSIQMKYDPFAASIRFTPC